MHDEGDLMPMNRPIAFRGNDDFVFVSYAHKDSELVFRDIFRMQEQGLRVWYDEGLTPGEEWDREVFGHIGSPHCKAVIFYLSYNVVLSASIEKEIGQVIAAGKASFSIQLYDRTLTEMMMKAFAIEKNTPLLRVATLSSFFNDKKTYIVRDPNPENGDHLESALSFLRSFDVFDRRAVDEGTYAGRVYGVVFLAKSSKFSNSLLHGIEHQLSMQKNVTLVSESVPDDAERSETFVRTFIESHLGFDGYIIRPLRELSDAFCTSLDHYINDLGKRIILMDLDATPAQRALFSRLRPVYVGSDFAAGGGMLGRIVNEMKGLFGSGFVRTLLFEGPASKQSVRRRCAALHDEIDATAAAGTVRVFPIRSLNVGETISAFRGAVSGFAGFVGRNDLLILFAGNDNIAMELMKIRHAGDPADPLRLFLAGAKEVLFLGYDGITELDGSYSLSAHGEDFATVDVVPHSQGAIAGCKIIEMFRSILQSEDGLAQPKLVFRPSFFPAVVPDLLPLDGFLGNARSFLFDLDGTIADTETLHWLAYDVLLSKQGIHLDSEHIARYIGNPEVRIYDLIRADYGAVIDTEAFLSARIDVYLDLVDERRLEPYPYVADFLRRFGDRPLGLLTSQVPRVIDRLLTKWGLDAFFPPARRVSVHDGTLTKQAVLDHPGKYFTADGVPFAAEATVLFEDSEHTLACARQAGLRTVGIEHGYNRGKLASADYIIRKDLTTGLFVGLCGLDVVFYDGVVPASQNDKGKTNDFRLFVGGPAANAAMTFALLGGKAILATCLGDSPMAGVLKQKLAQRGVTVLDLALRDPETPNISAIFVDTESGDRRVMSGQMPLKSLRIEAALALVDRVDFCLYDLNLGEAGPLLAGRLREAGVPLVIDAGSHKAFADEVLSQADTVISSEKFRDGSGRDIFAMNAEFHLPFVAKTRGAKSVEYAASDGVKGDIDAIAVDRVVDTLGAGDVFHGAYCYYRYHEHRDFRASLAKAMEIAALSVTAKGPLTALEARMAPK